MCVWIHNCVGKLIYVPQLALGVIAGVAAEAVGGAGALALPELPGAAGVVVADAADVAVAVVCRALSGPELRLGGGRLAAGDVRALFALVPGGPERVRRWAVDRGGGLGRLLGRA